MESSDESEYEEPAHILYDIVPYRDWEQEPEVIKNTDKNNQKNRFNYWPFSSKASSVFPGSVENILAHRLPWLFAVSQDANLVAVLQEHVLEVWHSKENYGTLVGRKTIRRDPLPTWRNLVWNEDNQLLAVAFSDGNVEICDTVGSLMYQIISPNIPASQPEMGDAHKKTSGPTCHTYVEVFFTNIRIRDKKWISELVLVDAGGRVNSFLVSPSGYQEFSSFSVGWNLTSAVYSQAHNLLITSGMSPLLGRSSLQGKASFWGICAYRMTNESPHYVGILEIADPSIMSARSFGFPFLTSRNLDHVASMSVDDTGQRLGVVHESGKISVWLLPGLLLKSEMKLTDQPAFDEVNPQLLQVPGKKKMKQEFLSNEFRFHPASISWWNQDSIIISRISGALSVVKLDSLCNLLGDAPEFLDGVPRLSQTFEKGFFALECESMVKGRRHSTKSESAGEDPDLDLEIESDDEETSWVQLGKRSAAAVAYFMTDNEKFAPPKKKSKIVKKTYRMIALISTTPEELYNRKIENEEYGEAIMLAHHYRLDTDAVYERQWRKSNKSVAAIHDYLGKIKRRMSVLKECLNTIPHDIDATRELLQYGLSGTDLDTLVMMSEHDTGEFIRSTNNKDDDDEWMADGSERTAEDVEVRAEKEKAKLLKTISKVNWQSLSIVQKDLIGSRLKLLYYLDILDIYEDALGGGQFAADKFDPHVYRGMRAASPIENCLTSARNMDAITISAFFMSIFSEVVLPHWLPIISSFPETTRPRILRDILPGLNMDGQPIPWLCGAPNRNKDWSEQALSMKWSGHKMTWVSDLLYAEDQQLKRFYGDTLSTKVITDWYQWRARTISRNTSIPELALELLQEGIEHNVEVDLNLVNNLRTLDALVYDVQVTDLNLETLEEMSHEEQMALLLSRSQDILQDIRSLLIPYLIRMDDARPGTFQSLLHSFCLHKSEKDLTIPLVLLENSRLVSSKRLVEDVYQVVQLGIHCCYAHNRTGQGEQQQIDYLDRISLCVREYFEITPGRLRRDLIQSYGLDVNQFDTLMKHMDIVRILHRNRVNKSLATLKDADVKTMKKLFDQVTRQAESSRPPLDQDGWRLVLKDLQKLQKLMPLVPMNSVYYSYCESLLASGSLGNIELAGTVMKSLMEEEDQVKVVLAAWKHYFTSSTNLKDENMNLAKQCLRLISFSNKEISESSDLILSLQSLADFGLPDIHPFTVLNSRNRLEFVTLALNQKPSAYRNSQRLMKLATLLRIEENLDTLQGMVWVLVATKALDSKDFGSCYSACENIMKNSYMQGWDICFALAVQDGFSDLAKCQDLLSFAVTHCDEQNIENIVLSRLKIEQKMSLEGLSANKSEVNDSVFETNNDADEGIQEDHFEDSVSEFQSPSREASPIPTSLKDISPFSSMKEMSPFPTSMVEGMKNTLFSVASAPDLKSRVMTVTSLSSQYLLDNQISRSVLDRTSSWIQQIALKESQGSFEQDTTINPEKLLIPAFYTSNLSEDDNCEDNYLDMNYKKFSSPVRRDLNLATAAQEGFRSQMISSVLLDSINNKSDPNEIANGDKNHDHDDVNSELGGIQIKINGDVGDDIEQRKVSPELLHELVSSLASQDVFQGLGLLLTTLTEDELEHFLLTLPQTRHCINLFLIFLATRIKAAHHPDLDDVFKLTPKSLLLAAIEEKDNEVTREVLEKCLEMAVDQNQAGVLSSLAGDVDVSRFARDQQYKEDTILGLARSLEDDNWAFTCRLAKRYKVDFWTVVATHTEAIFVDFEDAATIEAMLDKRGVVDSLREDGARWKVWSQEKIYPLLDGSNLEKLKLYFDTMFSVTNDQIFQDHSYSVGILQGAGLKLDYLSLLTGNKQVLQTLNMDTVVPVIQALDRISSVEESCLRAGDVYLYLANKEFISHGQNTDNWIEAFNRCVDLIEKLEPESFKDLMTAILLTEHSSSNFNKITKSRIIKKAIKVVEIKIASKCVGDWSSVLTWLNQVKGHHESLHSQLTTSILSDFPEEYSHVLRIFELTGGEEGKVVDMFIELLADHLPDQVFRKLVCIWKQDKDKMDQVMNQIFSHCINSLTNSDAINSDDPAPRCIQYMLEDLEFLPENARAIMVPLCTLDKLPVAHRLLFVKLLKEMETSEKTEEMADEVMEKEEEMFDTTFLSQMYQIEARLQELVPGACLVDKDLASLEAKDKLVTRIAAQIKQLTILSKFADFTAEFLNDDSSSQVKSDGLLKLVQLGLKMEESKDQKVDFVVQVAALIKDSEGDILKLCVQSDKEIYVKAVCALQAATFYPELSKIVQDLDSVEDTTLSSLVRCGLGGELASTSLYLRMVDAAISEEITDLLMQQLKDSGHHALAYSLQLTALRIPAALRTIASFKL